ncbi:MAG: hypothetical protein L3J74_01580 [Bacteroidales bacterium]|nr:hypothetical protein [Bacteroidales bacterium]
MAKKKRKISDIKSALLSNTSFIKNTEKEKKTEKHENNSTPEKLPDNVIEIDKILLSRIKILANYYQKDYQEIVGEALHHYLRIKKLDVDEALKNIVVGDDEE